MEGEKGRKEKRKKGGRERKGKKNIKDKGRSQYIKNNKTKSLFIYNINKIVEVK